MIRSRIAPTPSGYLHTGNGLNFVLTWLLVRKQQGILRLRIDDLDVHRANEKYVDDIFQTLDWLGIDWDEGPQTAEEHFTNYSQQLRLHRYDEMIKQVIEAGQAFACSCSRKAVSALAANAQYPGTCRSKLVPHHEGPVLRMITPEEKSITIPGHYPGNRSLSLYDVIRDPVLKRRDGLPAYHIASMADDIDHKINFIVRGADLLASTAFQLYLASVIKAEAFSNIQFYHHSLVLDTKGNKLSKSAGSASLRAWREQGAKPSEFYAFVSGLLGLGAKAASARELLGMVDERFASVLAGE